MLKDLGIKSRVLVLILLPSTVLAVALGIYFTWMQLSEMRHQLDARGQLIAEQLAPLAAPAMAQGYGKRLQRILNQVLDQPDVRAVSILDAERNLFSAQQQLLTTQRAYLQNGATLFVALGGGLPR